jgi:GT2 family glycosyltransferase
MATSIAVLTYNRSRLLAELLSELRAQAAGAELIVVDNHSDDDTPEVVRREGPGAVYIRTDTNLGASARNLGLSRATGDIIVCLDDDVCGCDSESLVRISKYFHDHPDVGAATFRVVEADTGRVCNWIHHRRVEDADLLEFETYEIAEGAVAFRAAAIARSGLYPDYFFLAHEGPDLALRIWDSGFRVVYFGGVTVRHARSECGRRSWMSVYYNTRNQYWFAARNLPLGYGMVYLLRGQLSTLVYALRDGHIRHWFRAVFDGIRGLSRAWADRRTVSPRTMSLIHRVERGRPSWLYMARLRLFRRDVRL